MNFPTIAWLYRADIVLVMCTLFLLVLAPKLERNKLVVSLVVFVAGVWAILCGTQETGVATLALVVVGTALVGAAVLLPAAELQLTEHLPEAAALLIIGAVGGIVLTTAKSTLEIALGVEMLSLSATALVGLAQGTRPLEGAFKYFILTAITFATLLFGMSLLFLGTGSFDIPNLGRVAEGSRAFVYAGTALMAVGLLFKLAAAPSHYGALDAYTTGPSSFVGFIMIASKLGAVVALTKLTKAAGPSVGLAMAVVGIVTIFVGVFASFAQTDLRRLLAYSAVAHAGFLALAAGSNGMTEARYYVVGYGAAALLCFAALAGTGTDPMPLTSLKPHGTRKLGKLRATALIVGLASLAGVPPLPGFWVKLAVLKATYGVWGTIPTVLAAVGGVVGIIYYLKPTPDLLAQGRTSEGSISRPVWEDALVVALMALVVMLSLWPAGAWSLAKG